MDPLTRFHNASAEFNQSSTPDTAEELLAAFEALSGAGAGGWGAIRRIEKAKRVFLDAGRKGSEDIPL